MPILSELTKLINTTKKARKCSAMGLLLKSWDQTTDKTFIIVLRDKRSSRCAIARVNTFQRKTLDSSGWRMILIENEHPAEGPHLRGPLVINDGYAGGCHINQREWPNRNMCTLTTNTDYY